MEWQGVIGTKELEEADSVAQRVRLVRETICRATERAGRHPDTVRLVAATKTVSVQRIQEGIDAGLSLLGENRMQEALGKMALLRDAPVRWHFIGQLQRRKVRSVIGLFDVIHSVDSVELAQEIDRRAAEAGIAQTILLEVNMGGESTKAGFHPEEIMRQIPVLGALSHLRIQGLMTIPPPTPEPEQARSYFRGLRELADRIAEQRVAAVAMQELSMGMSHDYEIAIEEGATLVRVGTAIFGARHV
jgi:pyridoxal phosphate enzyme (YggS family)